MICRLDGHRDQAGAWDVITEASGRVAWDVGANILQASRVMAGNFEQVVAFEPCVESYAIALAEAPSNVEVLPFAIGREDGTITLDVDENSINTGQLVSPGRALPGWGNYQGTRTVPCRSLDSLLMHNDPPDFVKIDVEGGEIEVLEGARTLFSRVRPAVIVEVHRNEHGSLVRELLEGYDLTELRHGPYARPGGLTWLNHFWLHGRHSGRA